MTEGGGENQRPIVTNIFYYVGKIFIFRMNQTDDRTETTRTVMTICNSQIGQIRTGGDLDNDEDQSSAQPTQALNQAIDEIKLTDEDRDNNFAEEQADLLMKDSKFSEAIDLLEPLPQSREQQMKLLECYFQLGRDSEMLQCIENMKMLVTRPPRPKAVDVYQLGLVNFEKSSHIKAMTFFACAAKIYREETDSNQGVRGIRECSLKSFEVIVAMFNQNGGMRDLACDVGMEIMKNICDDIKSVSDADPDVKANMEARCLNYTGVCYAQLKPYDRALKLFKRGIDIMKCQFGKNSSKYNVFGKLLNNMGGANNDLGNYSEAAGSYEQAIDAFKRADDWPNDEKKKNFIEQTENNLRIVRRNMEK